MNAENHTRTPLGKNFISQMGYNIFACKMLKLIAKLTHE